MPTLDIKIFETGNGGDIMLGGNDIVTVQSFENMPYLAMFGGNIAQSTDSVGADDEQRFDWWGNSFITKREAQMNSLTERKLRDTPLTSQGRQLIEQAVVTDLWFMRAFSTVTVSVRIISDDWLNIAIKIKEPSSITDKEFQFIWDAAKGTIRSAEDYVGFTPQDVGNTYRITESGVVRLTVDGEVRIIN
jgi:phage gp46-like protein